MANETKIYVGEQGAKALYKRLKEQLGKITTYQKVTNVTPEGVPIVAKPNTRTIYLVKDETVIGDDRYKEWIWNSVDLWECIGTTSIPENAWKQWSEDNGSSGDGDSVYIGKNNVLGRDESYSLGKNNTVEVTDDTVYVGTDVVEIGTSNAAMNAANAYQLGRENRVFGHNISYADPTLHGLALNVGRNNTITSEGVNLGKDNAASYFGVSIGQRNEANHSAYSMGNRVYANNASFAIGNGESNALTSTITLASYQLSDSTYVHVAQFRQKTPYTYCKLAAIYFNETTGKYEWIQIDDYGRTAISGGNSLSLLVNDDLKTYLSIWNGYSGAGKVVGYFDANGNFVADSSNPASKTYYKVVSVYWKNGGYINRTFYASMKDDTWPKSISNLKTYVGRPNPNYKYPDPGTILNEAQYAELRQNTIQLVGAYNDVYINPNDLSGTVYRSSNGYYPVIGDYEVYGFDKNNEFVPYNEITGKGVQPAECYWKTVTIDKIGTHAFKYADVFDEPVRIKSDNNSIVLSNGLADIDEHSIALVSNVYSAKVDIRGEQKNSFGFTNISFTVGTLDQATGRASWNSSITMQCPNVVGSSDYTNTIALPKAVVDDDSIGIIGAGSTTYSRVTGASIGIGSGLTVQGYSFGIGRGSTVSSASYSIGNNNNVSSKSFVFGQDNTSIREESIALGFLNYEIGDFYIGESRYYGRAVALGYNNRQVAQQSVAIGTNNSTVYFNSVCIGSNHNTVKDSAVSIGVGNSRIGSASVAIGTGLYDIDGSSICFGMGSTATSASFVVGNGCAGSSAIVMGMGAKGYGGSIVLGNGSAGRNGAVILGIGNNATESNTSVNPSNFYANAVVLGIGNQVRNVRESLNKNGWTSLVTTCGIAIGSYIKAYGHNFISLGCRNTLGDPDRWNADSRSTVTDNDGFMTAIGFDCVAFRNYDFAYGYQSTASGGENIAFQHSLASGFRNIAMVDATAYGTENISLIESNMTINLPKVTSQCSRNVLHHSTVNHSTSLQTDYLGFNDNILAGSTVNTSGKWVLKNTLIHGAITGPARVCESNIVLTGSSIALSGSIESVRNNILANNASLLESPYTAFCNASSDHPVSENFLLGTYAVNTYGCFSMSDIDAALRLSNSTRVFNFGDNTIFNTNDVTVFGGKNDIKGVKFVFTNGHLNTISSEKTYSDNAPGDIYVMGAENTVKLIDDSSVSEKSRCDRIYISGMDNTIQGTLLFENYIFGNGNKLQTPSPIQTLTGAEVHRNQIDNVDVSLFKVDSYALEVSIRNDTGRYPTTVQFAALWLYPNSVYFVDENVIMQTSAPSGMTTTSINIDVFIEKLKTNIAELNHKFYKLTGYSRYSTNQYGSVKISESIIPSSIVIYTGKRLLEPTYFYKIYDKTVSRVYIDDDSSSGQIGESDTNKYCARNSIIGNNNNIQSNVTDYTIIGLQNTLSNKLGPDVQPSWSKSISSGFIQGNNNEVSNGSNIISMGNGNVSTGHNSVAIGCQLISNQWQTVIGKYNTSIAGPNRLASETPQDPTKALLIVGNGYSTKDDKDWQDETYITRSNALELYADGRLKISGKIEASNIPPAPVADGQYALACDVVSGVATYRWVAVGIN